MINKLWNHWATWIVFALINFHGFVSNIDNDTFFAVLYGVGTLACLIALANTWKKHNK